MQLLPLLQGEVGWGCAAYSASAPCDSRHLKELSHAFHPKMHPKGLRDFGSWHDRPNQPHSALGLDPRACQRAAAGIGARGRWPSSAILTLSRPSCRTQAQTMPIVLNCEFVILIWFERRKAPVLRPGLLDWF